MAAKTRKEKTRFVCQACGAISPRWLGRCPECGEWNSLVEEKIPMARAGRREVEAPKAEAVAITQIQTAPDGRLQTQSAEFNRVLGGGIVAGSVILVGGDPGIGKSTLMLQEGAGLAKRGHTVLYVSGEESLQQTKLRAERLHVDSPNLFVLAETNLEAILEKIEQLNPDVCVIDSIQAAYDPKYESPPGSVSQIRECAMALLQRAKPRGMPLFLIGHVTKEGFIAGPKILEHMVDTVLYFEGDRNYFYRILRAVKNRFGSTNELGVFEMREAGLVDVTNPSEMFLSQRHEDISGSAVVCTLEGTRPILVEIQALVSPSSFGVPQRTATGIDQKRLAMLIAVLEKRVGLRLGSQDIFVNAAGGVRIDDPSADLGVVVAVASSLKNRIVDPKAVMLGEVGLGGEVRAVPHAEKRIAEARKLGFQRTVIPQYNLKGLDKIEGIEVHGVDRVEEALQILLS